MPREPNSAAIVLAPGQLDGLWSDLLSDDAGKAGKGIQTLASASKQSVPFLSEKIKPAAAVDVKKIEAAVADLNSSNFQKRTIATSTLEKVGDLAVPALKKALASDLKLETQRRIEVIIEKAITGDLTGDQLRVVRAMEVLEKAGTPGARQLLQSLAQGAPGAHLTRQAQQALDNLANRGN